MIAEATVWERLQHEQCLWVDPNCIDSEWFGQAYQWMCRQMAKRLPTYQGHFPWWAWHRWDTSSAKPDLRNRQMLHGGVPPGTPMVRLELDLPADRVLLSDFDLWHFVLNPGYLGWTEAETDAFTAQWERTPPLERDTSSLERSWERIFLLAYPLADPAWFGGNAATRIQGVFEELRREDIRQVTRYRARPTQEAARVLAHSSRQNREED